MTINPILTALFHLVWRVMSKVLFGESAISQEDDELHVPFNSFSAQDDETRLCDCEEV